VTFENLIPEPIERNRYRTLLATLANWQGLVRDKRILDFGASSALSIFALIELGAAQVIGVEPDAERVTKGRDVLAAAGLSRSASIRQSSYQPGLDFSDGEFDTVLCNAVLEHIPQPRTEYVREMWRVLARGGHLIINESPNKYLPVDFHTTNGLWLLPWMPKSLARRYAILRGRFRQEKDWSSSGWRGIGYWEVARGLTSFALIPETTRFRHKVFRALRLPPNLLDPYPTLIFRKL
jgi:SAM-dependent methyltransferase